MENFRTMLRAMWWKRLRAKMKEADPELKPKDVAKAVDMDRQLLYDYLKGKVKNPRGDMLAKLAEAVGVTENYLRFGDTPVTKVEVHVIPLLSLAVVSAYTDGRNLITEIVAEDTINVPVKHPERCFGVTSENTANVPEIGEGHIVVFDVGADLQPGKFILVSSPEEETAYIGKYRPLKPNSRDEFIIRFESDDYPEITANEEHKNYILARAVGVYKEL